MKTTVAHLEYGEQKKIKITGKYCKALARAVEGRLPTAAAEMLILSDDSDETSEIRILYSENGTMTDYIFYSMFAYVRNYEGLLDIISFNYIRDGISKTGAVIIAKDSEEELVDELLRSAEGLSSSTIKMTTLEQSTDMYK